MSETLVVGSVFVAIAGAIIYYAFAANRRNTERMAAFVSNTGLAMPPNGKIQTATFDGIDYAYQFVAASSNQPIEFRVWHPHRNRGHLIVQSERGGDRFFKRIGIVAEVQTGDRNFDDAYFINTAEPSFARAMPKRVTTRAAMTSLIAGGFDSVTLDDDRILATARQPRGSLDRRRPIGDTVSALQALAREQPRIPKHLGRNERASWKLSLQFLYVTLTLLAIAGFGLFFVDLDRFKPIDSSQVTSHCLLLLIPAYATSLYFLILVLRGRSSSHTHLGISALISLIALPFLISGLLMFANAYGDNSPIETHPVTATSKRVSHSKNGATYRVAVTRWRTARAQPEFVVSRALFKRIESGRTLLVVTTRAGKLGYEWLCDPIALAPE